MAYHKRTSDLQKREIPRNHPGQATALRKGRNCCAFIVLGIFIVISQTTNLWAYHFGDIDVHGYADITELYDDNIMYRNDARINDLRTDLSIGAIASYEGKLKQMDLSGNVTRQIYGKNSDLDNTSGMFDIRLAQEISKFKRIEFTNHFVRAYEPQKFIDEFGNIEGRYSYVRNRMGLEYTTDISRQWGATCRYRNEVFFPSQSDITDSYLNEVGFRLDYDLTAKTFIIGGYEYLRRDYQDADYFSTHRPSGGLKHFFTPKVSFIVRSGLDFTTGPAADAQGQFVEVAFDHTIDKISLLTFSYLKEISASAYEQDILESQKVMLSYNRQLLKRLNGFLNGFFGEGRYTSSDITDDFRGMAIGFSYDIHEHIRSNVSYSYSDKDSDVGSRDYTRNTIHFGINIIF